MSLEDGSRYDRDSLCVVRVGDELEMHRREIVRLDRELARARHALREVGNQRASASIAHADMTPNTNRAVEAADVMRLLGDDVRSLTLVVEFAELLADKNRAARRRTN